ncbi:winged helix-turn-helix domain-containing protein [Ancylobacter sonchi]|uniref:winged helix-turn-helix domain-containing protein n=1 Tax=Ancylobacter sonchi TaxID=1937790 RepID=UPI001BD33843|nr:winged helix-turn-helix domain-containing protein [Ancylobacter sonchi]MBS7535215.1 winged helix-turn-helix domain-containing protein [Ancylobacter sonchi]
MGAERQIGANLLSFENPPDRLEMDVRHRELRVNGSVLAISRRAFEISQILIEASGATVAKSELMSRVWPKVVVGDTALQVQISAIRKALGVNRALLRTISGKGYRLLGDWVLLSAAINADPARPRQPPSDLTSADRQPIYRSEECEIDLLLRQVRVRRGAVPIGGRAFDILAVLVQAANEVVTRGELLDIVWSGATVGETAIDVHISAIRKALGSYRAMLKTISGRGFRLVGEWSVHTTSAPPPPPSLPRSMASTNLPAAANDLVGRAASFAFLQEACSAYRIVTLTGPGGIGKTALAVELARSLLVRFDAGVWLVELASLADPNLVPVAVGEAIGLKANGRPMSAEGVARAIGHDRLLLVLDNCEHLIGSAAQLAEAVVRLAPNAVIVATSRETLRINGEYVYRVPPLDVPQQESALPDEILSNSAVQMFLGLAEAPHVAGLRDGQNLRSIAGICRRLDGLPLAIEFAAARSTSLGLSRVADGLENRFALLTTGRRTALPRHRTLRAVFDWSYALLPEVERRLLHRLAVFPGGFTFEAACAVMCDHSPTEVADCLSSLVEKSIVTFDRSTADERWRLLETVRAYAMDKLASSGDGHATARRQAEYFRDFFATFNSDPDISAEELPRYAREIDNLRAALSWAFSTSGDTTLGVALTAAAVAFWLAAPLLGECSDWTARAVANLNSAVTAEQEMVLRCALGQSLMFTEGMTPATYTNLAQALALAEVTGDVEYQKRAVHSLWQINLRSLDLHKALQLSRRYADLARSETDPAPARTADLMVGMSLLYLAEYAESSRLLERAIHDHSLAPRRSKVPSLGINEIASAHGHLSSCLLARGLIDAAIRAAERSMEEARLVGQPVALCLALARPACLLFPEIGALDRAERHIATIQEQADRYALSTFRAVALCAKGRALAMRGEPAAGVVALRSGLAQLEATGYQSFLMPFRGYFGEALTAAGHTEEGLAEVEAAVSCAEQTDYLEYVPELQCIYGRLLALRHPDDPAAEQVFLRAIDLSRQEQALYWELCAAVGLSERWLRQGREPEVRPLLAPIYKRFTEGFSAPALMRASTLLGSRAVCDAD